MPEDRRHSSGRRESDRILDAIWRELDKLKDDLRRDFDRLEDDFETFEEHVTTQVRELEAFHIAEQARAGEKLVEQAHATERRADVMARWTKVSIGAGALGVAFGIAEHLLG